MAVHRIIFRWDFQLSTTIMDRPGLILEALHATDPVKWDDITDTFSKRAFSVRRTFEEGKVYKTFSFDPTMLVFGIEWADGLPPGRLEREQNLHELLGFVAVIKERAQLAKLARCGVRFYDLSRRDVGRGHMLDRFREVATGPFSDIIQRRAGAVKDVGLVFEGAHEDGIEYSIRCGPYAPIEQGKYFEKVGSKIVEDGKNMIVDADFSEKDFVMTVSPRAWVRPLLARFDQLVTDLGIALRVDQ